MTPFARVVCLLATTLAAQCNRHPSDSAPHGGNFELPGAPVGEIVTGRHAEWTRLLLPFSNANGASLAFASDGALFLVVGKGVARSDDLGRTWQVVPPGRTESLYSNDGGRAFTTLARARREWFLKPAVDASFATLATVLAGDRLYTFGHASSSVRLSSYALTPRDRTVIHRVFCFDGPRGGCIAARSEEPLDEVFVGGVVGRQPVLYATHDGGRDWRPRWWGNAGDPTPVALTFLNEDLGLLLLDDGTLLRTSDAGSTWLAVGGVPLDAANDVVAMSWVDERIGYVVGRDALFLATSDGGRGWRRATPPTARTLNRVLAITAEDVWAVGDAGTIVRTKTGGLTWESVDLGIGEDLSSVSYYDGAVWIVGDGSLWIHSPKGGSPIGRRADRAPPAPDPFPPRTRGYS